MDGELNKRFELVAFRLQINRIGLSFEGWEE